MINIAYNYILQHPISAPLPGTCPPPRGLCLCLRGGLSLPAHKVQQLPTASRRPELHTQHLGSFATGVPGNAVTALPPRTFGNLLPPQALRPPAGWPVAFRVLPAWALAWGPFSSRGLCPLPTVLTHPAPHTHLRLHHLSRVWAPTHLCLNPLPVPRGLSACGFIDSRASITIAHGRSPISPWSARPMPPPGYPIECPCS